MANDFYNNFQFISNPFENNTAEREPNIALYAVRPPYLDRVLKTSSDKGIFVLTGSRGSGKSATRLTVSKNYWDSDPKRLVVPLIGFNVFRPFIKATIPLELFANQIAFLAIEQILSWLSALDDTSATKILEKQNVSEKAFVRKMLGHFYLNRSENARKASSTECFESMDFSIANKSLLWIDKRWDQVSSAVANFAAKLGEKYFEIELGDPNAYAELLKRQKQDGFGDPIYIFTKIVELARIFGFNSVAIHIDKVDETEWTTNSVEAACDLIYPLLANIQLHEIQGLTWTFFLWDKVKDILTDEQKRPVRWDKIPSGGISWNNDFLKKLVDLRIKHFSNNKLTSLADICEEGLNSDNTLIELIKLSENSPRSLITMLDIVVSEHIQANQQGHQKLDENAFAAGMDIYARKSLTDSGRNGDADQIAKIKISLFSTKDVAARFGINPQNARAKIDSWQKMGLIMQQESRVGAAGGRPVDYFSVLDPRVARVIERSL